MPKRTILILAKFCIRFLDGRAIIPQPEIEFRFQAQRVLEIRVGAFHFTSTTSIPSQILSFSFLKKQLQIDRCEYISSSDTGLGQQQQMILPHFGHQEQLSFSSSFLLSLKVRVERDASGAEGTIQVHWCCVASQDTEMGFKHLRGREDDEARILC